MTRRTDPDRRDRIVDAALGIIAEAGVTGLTYRAVAAAADVPLGSMTYHFPSREELLEAAFTSFSADMHGRFAAHLAAVPPGADAGEAVVAIITDQGAGRHRDMVLAAEMYALAVRQPVYKTLTQQWMSASRASLVEHFGGELAPMIDALLEGFILHSHITTEPYDVERVRQAFRRLISGDPS